MPLERLIDQPRARTLLERMVQDGRLPHALLFWGPPGSGKSVAAMELARWLNCREGLAGPCGLCDACIQFRTLENPHLNYVLPLPGKALVDSEEGELTEAGATELAAIFRRKAEEPYSAAAYTGGQFVLIGQIRAVLHWASRKSFDDLPRVALIDHADRLREEAGNALLKLLEEPPPNFILILTARDQEDILPTLRSRCQAVEFDRLKADTIAHYISREDKIDTATAQRIARLCGGDLSRALEFSEQPQQAQDLHELAINIVRHSLGRNPIEFDTLLEKWNPLTLADQYLILEIISTWLRDAALLQNLGSAGEARIIHSDRLDLLQKFVANCPGADFATAADKVDQARRRLEGNALAPLTLLVLSRELYHAVYHRRAV
jgi:DNA polymerase III subunit delta'